MNCMGFPQVPGFQAIIFLLTWMSLMAIHLMRLDHKAGLGDVMEGTEHEGYLLPPKKKDRWFGCSCGFSKLMPDVESR